MNYLSLSVYIKKGFLQRFPKRPLIDPQPSQPIMKKTVGVERNKNSDCCNA